MPAQIVFLTLFLGLVSGSQPVALQVSGPVKFVKLYLGEKEVAAVSGPSWRVNLDFGADLTPRDLTAVGFDANGDEVARAAQRLNLPRPLAEFDIVVARDTLSLVGRHLMHIPPSRAEATLDGKPLKLDVAYKAKLPKLDAEMPHFVAAEMQFEDGFVARRELVIESTRSDTVGTELTPVLVRTTEKKKQPKSWEGCLVTPSGKTVRTAAVERPPALLIVVKDPDPMEITQPLGLTLGRANSDSMYKKMMMLESDTYIRILWPVAKRYVGSAEEPTAMLFEPSADMSAPKFSFMHVLLGGYVGESANTKRQFADAAAVAGIRAITGSRRRAIIVILSASKDESKHDPAAVRRYLQSVGVPLFVWSLTGPRPEMRDTWGEVEDISSINKLTDAAYRVQQTLAAQRIAWVDVDPLRALHLRAKESCGIATVAWSGGL